ncbi:MAG: hypothetical protein P4L51_24710 [Puia sp.]|nr:hypothetical protein [Puia sp.]
MRKDFMKNRPKKKHLSIIEASRRHLRAGLLICLCVGMTVPALSVRAGCYCMMESKCIAASYNKTGFDALCSTNTIKKKFLSSKYISTFSGHAKRDGGDDDFDDITMSSKEEDGFNYHLTDLTEYPTRDGCRSWSLPWDSSEKYTEGGTAFYADIYAGPSHWWDWGYNTTNTADSEGDATDGCGGTVTDLYWNGFSTTYSLCDGSYYPQVLPGVPERPGTSTTTCTETMSQTTSTYDGPYLSDYELSYTSKQITTLSEEFTDDKLRKCIIQLLPPWPDWSPGPGTAFYSLTDDHVCGGGGKMHYRVKVPNSEIDVVYTLQWFQVTMYPDSLLPSFDPVTEEITGTGDPVNPAPGKDHFVDMPGSPCVIWETSPDIIDTKYTGGGDAPGTGGDDNGPITGG